MPPHRHRPRSAFAHKMRSLFSSPPRSRRTSSHPAEQLRHRQQLRALNALGGDVSERLRVLREGGLSRREAQALVTEIELEARGPGETPTSSDTLHWKGRSVALPEGWRPRVVDPGEGEEAGIWISGSTPEIFALLAERDDRTVETVVRDYASELRDRSLSTISRWGEWKGRGCVVTGVHDTLELPMELIVFRPRATSSPFLVVEYAARPPADLASSEGQAPTDRSAGAAFDLIRSTFEAGIRLAGRRNIPPWDEERSVREAC